LIQVRERLKCADLKQNPPSEEGGYSIETMTPSIGTDAGALQFTHPPRQKRFGTLVTLDGTIPRFARGAAALPQLMPALCNLLIRPDKKGSKPFSTWIAPFLGLLEARQLLPQLMQALCNLPVRPDKKGLEPFSTWMARFPGLLEAQQRSHN